MQSFDLYPQAWAVYIFLGIALLWLLDLKLRRTGFKRRVGVLSLIATGAFTPQTIEGANSFAPMLLVSLFDAEIHGVSVLIEGLITLLSIWGVIFASALAIRHFIYARKIPTEQKTSATKSESH